MNDKDLRKTYRDAKILRIYDGYSAGPVVDFIGTVMAGWNAADNHDTRYRIPGESKTKADIGLMTDMAKGSLQNLRGNHPSGLARAAIGIAITPLFYGAVVIGGGVPYRADQRAHGGR